MKLIVGLGNPGKKYEYSRHNVGFMVLDQIAKRQSLTPFRLENQYNAEITQTGGIGQERIIFAKPHTFMNLSGEAVQKIMHYYKIGSEDVWVVCDDLNLSVGTIRVRSGGDDGGHNGLNSIIGMIGKDFTRVRVGIGSNREKNISAETYVLQTFDPSETKNINESIDKAAQVVISSLSSGMMQEQTFKI